MTLDFSEKFYDYYQSKYQNEEGGTCGKNREMDISLEIENHKQNRSFDQGFELNYVMSADFLNNAP